MLEGRGHLRGDLREKLECLSSLAFCCANFNTRKRTNRLQYSVCASARSYPQRNGQILVSCLINLILT
jgi:hypothetical protein